MDDDDDDGGAAALFALCCAAFRPHILNCCSLPLRAHDAAMASPTSRVSLEHMAEDVFHD